MLPDITVRALTEMDWQAFAALRLEALEDSPEVFYSNLEREQKFTETDWRGWFTRASDRVFGLYDTKKMIGQIGVFHLKGDPTGTSGVIGAVYVTPTYRGRKLAHMMYHACIAWAVRHEPWRRLVVSHRVGNDASRSVIVAQGFVFTHRSPQTWPNGAIVDEDSYEIDLIQRRNKA